MKKGKIVWGRGPRAGINISQGRKPHKSAAAAQSISRTGLGPFLSGCVCVQRVCGVTSPEKVTEYDIGEGYTTQMHPPLCTAMHWLELWYHVFGATGEGLAAHRMCWGLTLHGE